MPIPVSFTYTRTSLSSQSGVRKPSLIPIVIESLSWEYFFALVVRLSRTLNILLTSALTVRIASLSQSNERLRLQ